MNKPLTVMIIDGATWYSENDWRILVAQKLDLEAKLSKAVEVLERIATHDTQAWAIKALAELKGQDDD